MATVLAGFRTDTSTRISDKVVHWFGFGTGDGSAQKRLSAPSDSATAVLSHLEHALEALQQAAKSGVHVFSAGLQFCDQTRSGAISLFVLRAWLEDFRQEWIERYVKASLEGADLIAMAIQLRNSDLSDEQRTRCAAYLTNIQERARRLAEPSSSWGIVISLFRPLTTSRFACITSDILAQRFKDVMIDSARDFEVRDLARELLLRGEFSTIKQWIDTQAARKESRAALHCAVGHIAPFLFGTNHLDTEKIGPSWTVFGLLVAAMELGNLAGELIGEKGPLKSAFPSLQLEAFRLVERLEIVADGLCERSSDREANQIAGLADRVRANIESPLTLWKRKHDSHPNPTPAAKRFETEALDGIRGEIAESAELLAQAAFHAAVTHEPLETVLAEYDAQADPVGAEEGMIPVRLERVLAEGGTEELVGSYRVDDLEKVGIHLSEGRASRFRCQVISRKNLKGGGKHIVLLPWKERKLTAKRENEIDQQVEKSLGGDW